MRKYKTLVEKENTCSSHKTLTQIENTYGNRKASTVTVNQDCWITDRIIGLDHRIESQDRIHQIEASNRITDRIKEKFKHNKRL